MMKSKLKKGAAVALAVAMCMPVSALAADATATEGTFNSSFDVYSPTLTVSVPLKADIRINPFASSSATDTEQFTVASNSIDVMNASVDVDNDKAIPVNVSVSAKISSKKDDVVTEYNAITAKVGSAEKRINLNLAQAGTPGTAAAKSGETLAFTTEKKLNLAQFEISAAANYKTPAKKTAVTQWGSALSVDIAGPSTTDTTTGATFSTTASKVTPAVGSFAVIGEANYDADWKADDLAVTMTYKIKASNPRNINTPTVAPVTVAANADMTVTVPNVGDATVAAIAVHNDKSEFKDYFWSADDYTVTYAANSTTTTQTDATIKIAKENAGLQFLATDDYKGKTQDFVIALSDGRYVVTTLKVG